MFTTSELEAKLGRFVGSPRFGASNGIVVRVTDNCIYPSVDLGYASEVNAELHSLHQVAVLCKTILDGIVDAGSLRYTFPDGICVGVGSTNHSLPRTRAVRLLTLLI